MENGNFAEAQLRALIDVAARPPGRHRLEDVLELAAERSPGCASAELRSSISSRTCRDRRAPDARQRRRAGARRRSGSPRTRPTPLRTIRRWSPSSTRAAAPSPRWMIRKPTRRSESCCVASARSRASRCPCREGSRGASSGSRRRRARRGSARATRPSFVRSVTSSSGRSTGPSCSPRSRRSPTRTRSPGSRAGARWKRLWSRRATLPAPRDPPALVLCDIDDLKQVNDSGGHEAGDKVLCCVAEALVEAAGPTRMRWSGASAETSSASCFPPARADAKERGARGRAAPEAVGGGRMSCGVAARTEGRNPASRAAARADAAQYQAKRAGATVDVLVAGEAVEGQRVQRRPRPRVPCKRSRRPARPRAPRDARQHEWRVRRGAAGAASALDSSAKSDLTRCPGAARKRPACRRGRSRRWDRRPAGSRARRSRRHPPRPASGRRTGRPCRSSRSPGRPS